MNSNIQVTTPSPASTHSAPWTEAWARRFAHRAQRPLPEPPRPDCTANLEPALRAPLLRSLQIFQKGESGEARILSEIRKTSLPEFDDALRASIAAFIREEGTHSTILARTVRALGGSIKEGTWTDTCFKHVRRLFGIRFKLLVLMVAEVVGICFYDLIAPSFANGPTRNALRRVCSDEEVHLEFHTELFRAVIGASAFRRLVFLCAYRLVGTAARIVVCFDHRGMIRALGASPKDVSDRFRRVLRAAEIRVTGSETVATAALELS